MGIAEFTKNYLLVHSHIITYGNAADLAITELIRDEIETMWNEPEASFQMQGLILKVHFKITAALQPEITPVEIYQNLDPRNNYFRIEEFAHGNISFVDGLGCNSGYFKLENLYKGSTTAAHEYGHTLGLEHPTDLDIRGLGVPGIMYPRGTLVDPPFQYNPAAIAGDNTNGGTMHPRNRKVLKKDIEALKLQKLNFQNNKAVIGEFTNLWHPDHQTISHPDYFPPGILG
ncbi:MAG TPA: peptidase M10 [Chitinophagaceae bacterium]|nr:peptidase M10 [Chitinophagaceae bacterium]